MAAAEVAAPVSGRLSHDRSIQATVGQCLPSNPDRQFMLAVGQRPPASMCRRRIQDVCAYSNVPPPAGATVA